MDPQPESTPPPTRVPAPGSVLSCRELVSFLDDYLAEELPPERRAVSERHLALCDDCRRYLQSYRATVELSRAAFAD